MATGIASGAWGYSPQMVAGMDRPSEIDGKALTYQLGLTSTPVIDQISPLTVASNFGKKQSEISYLKTCLKIKTKDGTTRR